MMAGKNDVFILSLDEQETNLLCSMLSEGAYGSKVFRRVDELTAGLRRYECLATILDVDSVPMNNRIIRVLKDTYPGLNIFCTSRRRLHPELQEAFSQHVYANLSKPVDPDELQFWLNSIRENEVDSNAPA